MKLFEFKPLKVNMLLVLLGHLEWRGRLDFGARSVGAFIMVLQI